MFTGRDCSCFHLHTLITGTLRLRLHRKSLIKIKEATERFVKTLIFLGKQNSFFLFSVPRQKNLILNMRLSLLRISDALFIHGR